MNIDIPQSSVGTFSIGKGRNSIHFQMQLSEKITWIDRFRMKFCEVLTLGWIRWELNKDEKEI